MPIRLYHAEKRKFNENWNWKWNECLSDKDQIFRCAVEKWVRVASNADNFHKQRHPRTHTNGEIELKIERKKYWLEFNWPHSFWPFFCRTSTVRMCHECVCVSFEFYLLFFHLVTAIIFSLYFVFVTASPLYLHVLCFIAADLLITSLYP